MGEGRKKEVKEIKFVYEHIVVIVTFILILLLFYMILIKPLGEQIKTKEEAKEWYEGYITDLVSSDYSVYVRDVLINKGGSYAEVLTLYNTSEGVWDIDMYHLRNKELLVKHSIEESTLKEKLINEALTEKAKRDREESGTH